VVLKTGIKKMPQIFVSIGTNINRRFHLSLALKELHQTFGTLKLSSVYQSEAVGFEGDDFYNMVVGFFSDASIDELRSRCKAIEKMAGRDPAAPKFSARTLDLDLLNYGDRICQSPIVLPREEILYNAFVLWPMAEIAPAWIHPVAKKTLQALWNDFDKSSQQLAPIADPIDMSKYGVDTARS
jgi:2-amino-4-hydroxy-6-hydroxymethyldihydropteridine diphosphokinase